MKVNHLITAVAIFICFFQESFCFSQVLEPTPGQSRIIPYAHVREADVLMSKRVWRKIDLKEKINHPLYYPISPIEDRKSLFDVIKHGLLITNSIIAYNPGTLGNNDEFTKQMTIEEIKNLLYNTDSVWVEDTDGEMIQVIQNNFIKSEHIKQYDIKEEWFFDSKYSVMKVRIIGICPLVAKIDEVTGETRGYMPLFWIYFPNLRSELVSFDYYNRQNDIRLTYDAVFSKRMFSSYIIKESNVYDRFINEYKLGMDALLEADNIKQEIFNYEQDVWNY